MAIYEDALLAWAPRILSVLRIMTALLFVQYGLSKNFGFPANPPPHFTTFSLIGLAGVIELVGGLLLLVGFRAREAAFILSGEIAVAYFMRRAPNGFFPQINLGGQEVMLCFVCLYLVFSGPGPWSVDAMRRPGQA